MSSPVLPLRAAIRTACLADAPLAGLMGGAVQLYDEAPRGASDIHAVFGPVTASDNSTSLDRGHVQDLSVVVWASPLSAASALAVAERIADLLDDAPLTLAGHRLVHLAVTALEAARDRTTNLFRARLRLRAVTEIAG